MHRIDGHFPSAVLGLQGFVAKFAVASFLVLSFTIIQLCLVLFVLGFQAANAAKSAFNSLTFGRDLCRHLDHLVICFSRNEVVGVCLWMNSYLSACLPSQ